jgi:CBS domain-containing protein
MADKKDWLQPVLSAGALVGLVTTTDILRYLSRKDWFRER